MAVTTDGLVFAIDKTIADMKKKLNSFPLSGDGKQNILTAIQEIEKAVETLQARGKAEQWDIKPRLQSFLEALQAFPEAVKASHEDAETVAKTAKSYAQDAIWAAEWVKNNFPTTEAPPGAFNLDFSTVQQLNKKAIRN